MTFWAAGAAEERERAADGLEASGGVGEHLRADLTRRPRVPGQVRYVQYVQQLVQRGGRAASLPSPPRALRLTRLRLRGLLNHDETQGTLPWLVISQANGSSRGMVKITFCQ